MDVLVMTTRSPNRSEDSSLGRLLSRRELRRLVPVSDMTIWRWEEAGLFPRHLSICGRNFWRESEVRAFIDNQGQAAAEANGIVTPDTSA
jgi:predicted DNA-binding transcriptional regulator AlpA